MKKNLLLFALTCFIRFANAQTCTPDLAITQPGMYPDTYTNLPYAYVGVAYSTSVQFKVLTDTTISGTYVTVTSVTLDSVSGMPAGFTFSSNPANGVFPGGSNACASIYGTPQSGTGGTYHLVVHLTVHGIALGFVHVTQPETVTGYKIVINAPPGAHFSGTPTSICEGEFVVYTNTSSGHPTAWAWSFPGGTPSSSNLQTPPPIVYATSGVQNASLTVYSPAGSDVQNYNSYITVNNGPAASVNPSGNVSSCSGVPVTLSANTGTGLIYQWMKNGVDITGAITSTYNATTTGNYSVRVSIAAGCLKTSAATNVNVSNVSASISAGGPTTFCDGENVLLTANSGAGLTYQWKKDGTNISGATNVSYTADVAGAYKVTVTNSGGCSAISGGIVVSVNNAPSASINANGPVTICRGQDVSLTANTGTGLTYQWTSVNVPIPGATGSSYTASLTGWYRVTVTNSTGCTRVSNMIHVYVNSLPSEIVDASGPLTFCEGEGVKLTSANSGTGFTYQWTKHNVNISGATGKSYTATSDGIYRVRVTNSNGCLRVSEKVTISVNSLPNAVATANGPLTFCDGQSVTLTANSGSGFTYQWTKHNVNIPGATGISYNAVSSGTYKVIVANSHGCTKISSGKSVTVNNLPNATITASGPLTFCQGQSVNLTANSGAGLTRQWTKHNVDIPGETGISYLAKKTGSYRVVVTNLNGCSKTAAPKNVLVNCREEETGIAAEETSAVLYPNPTSSVTAIDLNLAAEGMVSIKVFDMAGKLIADVAEGNFTAGKYQFNYDASLLENGIYLVRITMGDGLKTIKLAVNKN